MPARVYAKGLLIVLLAAFASAASRGQDVAEAARQQKAKKEKQKTDSTQEAAKKKVYTNDEIPQAKDADSPPAAKQSPGSTAAPGDTKTKADPASNTASKSSEDAATLEFHLSSANVKRPGSANVNWQAKNISDHNEKLMLTMVVTGPCNYRRETAGSGFELRSGGAMGDNQYVFVAYPSDCAGIYKILMSLRAGEAVLSSSSATATVE